MFTYLKFIAYFTNHTLQFVNAKSLFKNSDLFKIVGIIRRPPEYFLLILIITDLKYIGDKIVNSNIKKQGIGDIPLI